MLAARRTVMAAGALIGLLFAASPPALAEHRTGDALVVFGDSSYPPYESLIDGKPAGANVDLWNAIGRTLGRPIDMRLIAWEQAQREVLAGAGDALSFVALTEERQRLYDFTRPTFTFRFPIFARANDLTTLSLQDLSGKRIAVKRGGFPVTALARLRPEAIAVPVDSVVEGFRMLLRGEVDGVMETEWVGYDLLRAHRFSGIHASPDALAVRTAHIAIRKGDTDLLREIDRAIGQLTESYELDRIADKWAGTDFVVWDRRDFQRTTIAASAGVVALLGLLGGLYVLRVRRANRYLRNEIAKREATQNQLYQAQKMEAIGQLAGGIAHDFNNLIGAILGFANFIVDDTDSKSREHGYARRILAASRRARELIQQILAFSRFDPGSLQPTALPALLEETAELLRATLPSTITVAIEARHEGTTVRGNPTQLTQVLVNLGINAADALAGARGRITLSVDRVDFDDRRWSPLTAAPRAASHFDAPRSEPGVGGANRIVIGALNPGIPHVVVSVRDDGPGMAAATLARIFEPFYTTKPRGKGTGLGLSVVQRIVLAHEGAVHVTSKPGEGTTFEIVLPATDDIAEVERPVLAVDPAPKRKKAHVIVVDDDVDFGDMVSVALDRAGYESAVVNHPHEALEAFDEEDAVWDIVVTDQTMPEISGLELIGRLKARRPGLRCLLCTAYTVTGLSREEALAAGADAFLNKPIEIADLLETVAGLLALEGTPGAQAQPGLR